jgi:hypothetical protein
MPASAQLREFDIWEPRSQQPLLMLSAPTVGHTRSASTASLLLTGLIKLFSQTTREVVRSPGPGARVRSTAFLAFNLCSNNRS